MPLLLLSEEEIIKDFSELTEEDQKIVLRIAQILVSKNQSAPAPVAPANPLVAA